MQRRIGVCVQCCSRHDLFRITMNSYRRHFKFSGELEYFVHEDRFHKEASEKLIEIAYAEFNIKFSIISDPPAGVVGSIGRVFNHLKALGNPYKYMIKLEEDTIALRQIDLDLAYDVMEACEDVNQIIFDIQPIYYQEQIPCKRREVVKNNVMLTTAEKWKSHPSLWRLSYIMPKYSEQPTWQHWVNEILGHKTRDVEWCMKNLGSYYFGPMGTSAYCLHIGRGRSIRWPEGKDGQANPKHKRTAWCLDDTLIYDGRELSGY